MALVGFTGGAVRRFLDAVFRPTMTSTPDSINPSDIIVALQEVRATTQIQALRSAAELSLNIYFDAQTSDHELHNLHLLLAEECCRIVHRILSIPSIQASHTTASSLAEDVQHLLRILRDIQDQLRDPRVARRITCNRVEQYQRDLNHRLNRILNEQSRLTSDVQAITSDSAGDGVQGPVLFRLLTCMFSIAPTPSLITDVASKIHMGLLLFIPLLYSSRIQGILSEVNHGTGLETQFVTTEDDLGASRPRMALGLWDTFSRGLVKEWMALRVLSGLILATIFSMLQISGFQGNEPMMVATLFSFAAVVYSSILMIYVNGWRGNSGASRWIQEIHEPFTIGFLWNTWILLALPAIWTAWGATLFLIAMVMAWISSHGGGSDGWGSALPASGGPAIPPRFAAFHPWFIPLFAIAVIYLVLMIYTLRGLGRRCEIRDNALAAV